MLLPHKYGLKYHEPDFDSDDKGNVLEYIEMICSMKSRSTKNCLMKMKSIVLGNHFLFQIFSF